MRRTVNILLVILIFIVVSCKSKKADPANKDTIITAIGQQINLAAPYQTKSVRNYCKVIGWPKNVKPIAPAAFKVNLYADSLDNPRNIYVAPNGDVLIAEANTEIKGLEKIGANIVGASSSEDLNKSANKIILYRDTNGDGKQDLRTLFLSGLNQPFGMLINGNWFYVANTDGIIRYHYKAGQTKIEGPGTTILNLPAGGYNNHWTRNLCANAEGTKIYVSVGSGSNDGDNGIDNEKRRADIIEIDPDGSHEQIYASGLRNPAGIAINTQTNVLWAAVNERDGYGDNLVPDYMTSVKRGGFYGWPYAYYGKHEDPAHKGERADMVAKSIVPDFSLGSHTASLGFAFYNAKSFPAKYAGGAFIGQHGSWNSSKLAGYKVTFIPFKNGKPVGKMEDFLTGFIADPVKQKAYGRPVGVAVNKDGSLLVADDSGNKVWRVSVR